MRTHATLETALVEIAFWRADTAARLEMAMMVHDAATKRGDEDGAAKIRVDFIRPALAALRDADAWEWYERCEVCGGFMQPGERAVGIEDGGAAHAACMGLSDQGRPIDGPEHDAKVIAEARELFALD